MIQKILRASMVVVVAVMLWAPLAGSALAAGKTNYGLITAAEKAYGQKPETDDVVVVAGTIAGALLALLGIVFLIQVVVAGISWMTAQGNDEKITQARSSLIHGAVGLVVVVAAYSLASYALTLAQAAAGVGK